MEMQTHDYIGLSFFKNQGYWNGDKKFEGMELKLGLSLPGPSVEVDTDEGMDLKEECARGKEIRSDCRLRSKRVYSQAFGCGEERERSLLSLQICGGYYQEVQSNNENEQADESSTSPIFNSGVGWPPVGSFRKNIITALHSSFDNEIKSVVEAESPCLLLRTPKFVKVIMDGIPIGRKVDLNAHNSYKTLALAIQDMFQLPKFCINGVKKHRVDSNTNNLCLFDDSSNYILTYIDNDGDWMLVGDAPWGTFVNSVRRLRVAKKSRRVVSICNPLKRVWRCYGNNRYQFVAAQCDQKS